MTANRVSQQLWQANQDLAQACLSHPFVQGIATGSLPRHQFAYYVAQDAFFLEAFARAYSIAAAKAPDWESFVTFHSLTGGVLTELELHREYAGAWGIELARVEPGHATRRYTDFLLATAWAGETVLTAVAMAPCLRLYTWLAQQIAGDALPQHPYTDWIRTYSDQSFEALTQRLEEQIDRYLPSLTPQAESAYRYAMLCEREFFTAASRIST